MKRFRRRVREGMIQMGLSGRPKIFCIGRNKTGTTSLRNLFRREGLVVAAQKPFERLFPSYVKADYDPILKQCAKAPVFQDIPFSLPGMYEVLDSAFPGSKFILSVRSSPEEWYHSLVRYHSAVFGNGRLPTRNDLETASYIWKGWAWEVHSYLYDTSGPGLYDEESLIGHYLDYNESVRGYFCGRPNDLIEIDVSNDGDYNRLQSFLRLPMSGGGFRGLIRVDTVIKYTHPRLTQFCHDTSSKAVSSTEGGL